MRALLNYLEERTKTGRLTERERAQDILEYAQNLVEEHSLLVQALAAAMDSEVVVEERGSQVHVGFELEFAGPVSFILSREHFILSPVKLGQPVCGSSREFQLRKFIDGSG
jgi:hypothetical protein